MEALLKKLTVRTEFFWRNIKHCRSLLWCKIATQNDVAVESFFFVFLDDVQLEIPDTAHESQLMCKRILLIIYLFKGYEFVITRYIAHGGWCMVKQLMQRELPVSITSI